MAVADTPDEILNTPVTWAEFESNLRSALGTEARLGTNKSVVDIGDGNGFVSCCGLITCDWVGAAAEEKLPKAVVLKIPSLLPFRKLNESLPPGQKFFDFDDEKWAVMEAQVKDIHNIEVATYDFVEEFEGLKMPRKIFGRAIAEKESGQMCLEYMDNTRTMNIYEKHSVEQLRQANYISMNRVSSTPETKNYLEYKIARALGKIQACSLKKEATNPDLQKEFFKMMVDIFPLENYRGMFKGIYAVDTSETTRELMEKIDKLVQFHYGSNIPTSLHRQMGFRPVLVNGDLHTGNVLIDKDTEDLVALIDWQCTHLGVGVEDLHRIAMSSLLTAERRASMSILIEVMYDSLVENLDGAEPPYTLEELLLISNLVFPQIALFFASNFIAMLTKMEKDPKLTDSEKEERKEVMLDKILGTLEDVVEIHESNKKHMDKLKLID